MNLTRFVSPGYLAHNLNRQVQEMYWARGIADFAMAAIMLFEPIFLMTYLDYSLSGVIWFFLAAYVVYLFIMPWGAKIAASKGYEHSILYSSLFMVLYWALLYASQETQFWIYLAPLALALQKALYWPAFHANMARFSSADQRGRENSGLYALVSIVFILAPLAGGFILARYGFMPLFLLGTSLMLLSNLPLFTTPEQFVPKPYRWAETWELFKQRPREIFGYWGFGEELTQLVIWPVFIFMAVPDFFQFGTIVSISTLFATLVMLYVGALSDRRSKPLLTAAFGAVNGVFWFIRPFLPGVGGILVSHTLGSVGKHSLIVPVTALTYDRANERRIMPYTVFFEQNLVIGKILMMVLVLASLQVTASFAPLFILAGLFSFLFIFLK